MRTTETLFDMEEIPILWQYLYMSEDLSYCPSCGVEMIQEN
jgi:hypothetical protein